MEAARTTNTTELHKLKRVVERVIFIGLSLVGEVDVVYVVENRSQIEIDKAIDGTSS